MLKSLKNNITTKVALFSMLLSYISTLYCQERVEDNFVRFVDSADVYIDAYPIKAQVFLDSIPQPLEKTIKGRLSDYYNIKALVHDSENEYAQLYQCYVFALKHAEKEKNYRVAGYASLELFNNIYIAKKDTTAYRYLEKAKKYYKLDNYTYGLLEIQQTYEYVKFLDGKYLDCNNLIFKYLETYKKTKDEPYFYMFANYMLILNYIRLSDFEKAYKYFSEFKTLKDNPAIVKYNYFSFEATINLSLAEVYFKKKQLDSTSYYLSKSTKLRNYMGEDVVKDYFNLKAHVYKSSGDIEKTNIYLDSLLYFEKKMFSSIVDASFHLNKPLLEAEVELESESYKKYFNGVLAVLLFCLLSFLSIFYLIYYKKQKSKQSDFMNQVSNFSYLKSNNEKLVGKVHGLEEYISSLKKEIKEISTINDVSGQREKITELYKALHLNSSTLLDKSESHLELVNNLNVEFFNKAHLKYPQLNDSEIITCYYLFMGFKNKEIAMFLNISVRALESKRYRISRKLNINRRETTLLEHLNEIFKNPNKELLN